jgi:FtsH-binding integral membrane protein
MPFDSPSRFSQPRVQAQPSVIVQGASDVERRFMSAVYRWMTVGLAVTAGVALWVSTSQAALQLLFGSRFVMIGLVVAQLGLVIALSAAAQRLSAPAAGALFILYSALTGAMLSSVLLVYTGASVGLAFVTTAGTFGAMSVYGTVTQRDLTGWRTFLMMGLVGMVIASVVNIFLHSSALSFVYSCVGVVVFTGLTAYDTQKLRAFARAGGGTGSLAVNGALSLYLDFVNLFLSLLRILGGRRD